VLRALESVDVAYYLIHSLGTGTDQPGLERQDGYARILTAMTGTTTIDPVEA
jgi:hypothetical protein